MVFSRYFSDFTLKLPKQKSSLAPDYVWTNAGRALPDPLFSVRLERLQSLT